MKRSGIYIVATIAALSVGCAGMTHAHRSTVSRESGPFEGVWHVEWCEAGQTSACGGFTAYLIQQGKWLCGSHFGSDTRQNRLDEGEPSSISGEVQGNAADVQIISGRNHGIYRARITPVSGGLSWTNEAEVRPGDNGEPAFVPDRDVLRRVNDAEELRALGDIRLQCDGPPAR